jgi:hypothetical protein
MDAGNTRKNRFAIISEIERKGLLTPAERIAFREFFDLRNQVVHGRIESPTDSQAARFLDFRLEISSDLT